MAREQDPLDVLMSVHPRHAESILSGTKTVEFRRRPPRRRISYLFFYATAPIQRVVGFAKMVSVVEGSLEALWSQFGSVGGISREEFDRYFEGVEEGCALVITDARRLEGAAPTGELPPEAQAPQSFRYLPTGWAIALAWR